MIDFNNGALFKLKKTSNDDISKQIEPLLISGEIIISTYKTIRDYVVFTSKRVIAINVQGITGAKKDYTSLPYSKIQAYSIETAGTFDLDSELEMYFSGLGKVKFDFKGSSDIIKIEAVNIFVYSDFPLGNNV
ncbi:PH domain-containing protein [Clostridium botulinum]|uniref:PH domain-containing protein n=1 Tax=Clostridium botulinum TaxID=1491 RepID=A0A6M0SY41_CLOBO|nr:PH domain-containing protein [Clostridium botulinum]